MRNARVLLAPSLVDGVPNVLYEAMVSGAFPIISPLDTITPVVSEPQNVFFARNLYPQEIADALDKAMNDDQTVDFAVENNFRLVKKIASHEEISCLVGNYYITLQRKTA
jgi:glycosyltransferase involved in cell wall biosynthesis